mmetsp:Transcript_5259/g.8097  ORF Transcript_5259/g.8097 Transcript_5259/m.8097 type:complete len:87 (+) Transcript_5259:252-512(+)
MTDIQPNLYIFAHKVQLLHSEERCLVHLIPSNSEQVLTWFKNTKFSPHDPVLFLSNNSFFVPSGSQHRIHSKTRAALDNRSVTNEF